MCELMNESDYSRIFYYLSVSTTDLFFFLTTFIASMKAMQCHGYFFINFFYKENKYLTVQLNVMDGNAFHHANKSSPS